MVAQPVDSNTAARDSMSPAPGAPGSTKEAEQADAMSDRELSEDPPSKVIDKIIEVEKYKTPKVT